MTARREIPLCHYRYDPLDQLISCAMSAQTNTQRFYLKDRLANEVQGAVQRSIMQHGDQLLAEQRCEGGPLETTILATDQQRSVLTTLDSTRPHTLAYTPYGHRIPENGLLSLLGFSGERPDPVTGCYLLGNGYRAFNPVLMRFNSPDNLSPFGKGGVNAYAYCVGDPVNRVDPTGHVGGWALLREMLPDILQRGAAPKYPWGNAIPGTVKRVSPTLGPRAKLNDMPEEMLAKIFDHLKGRELTNVSLTSKQMKRSIDALSAVNMKKQLDGKLPTEQLPLIDAIGFGEVKGVAPSAAVNTGVTLAQAQQDFPYAMTRLVGPNNRTVHYGSRPDLLPQVHEPNEVAAQIRAMNGDIFQ